MRRLVLVAALVFGVHGPAQASLDNGIAAFQNRPHNDAASGLLRLAQSSLAVIDAPKRIDTDQETVDFSGRAMAPGEVTLTVNGDPVPIAPDGSFHVRQQVPVGRSRLTLVLEGSYGDKAEHKVFVRRTAAVTEKVDFGTFHALVIGNNNYDHLNDLKMASADAAAVAALLERRYGFAVETLIDATRYDIISALARKRAQLTERDNLLIYYAGHGILDASSDEGYWLPTDAESDNPVNWISNATISAQLRAMLAKHVIVVADSCYSGKLTRNVEAGLKTGVERSAWFKRMNARRSRTALTSGGLEPVLDAGGGGHSVFAKAFLEALENNTQVLDGQALFNAIKRPIVVNADQTPEYADVGKAGHNGGDFLFVPVAVTPEAAVAMTPEAPASAAAPAATIVSDETALWRAVKDSSNPNDYQAYLDAYPNDVFAPLAKARIRALNAEAEIRAAERTKPFELAFWEAITDSTNAADYAAYLEQFPDGEFAPLARVRLAAAERIAAEEAERERAAAEVIERERRAAEEAERARRAAEEAERERRVAEQAAREEAERKAAEEAKRKEAERKAAEEARRKEAERIAAEEAAREAAEEAKRREAERLAAEAAAKAERLAAEAAAKAENLAAERALWDAVKTNATAADYRAYLAQYPDGLFATLAQIRLAEVERKATAEAERNRKEAERKAAEEARRKEAERKAAEKAKAERGAQQEITTALLVAPPGTGAFDGEWVGQISNEHVHLYKDIDITLTILNNMITWNTEFLTKKGMISASLRGTISDSGDFFITSLFSGSGGWGEWRISMHGKFTGDHAAGWLRIDHGRGPFVIKRVSRSSVAEAAAEREPRAAEKANVEREAQKGVQTSLLVPPGAGAFDGVWEGTISNDFIVGSGRILKLIVSNNVITLDTVISTRSGMITISTTGIIDDSGKFYLWDKFEAMGSWYQKLFSMDGKFSGNWATGKLKISQGDGRFDLERVSRPPSPKASAGP